MQNNVYLYVLAANFCFALGSQVFTHYTRKISSTWMNFAKASIASILFAITISILGEWHSLSFMWFSVFFLSGLIGLGTGDIFLLKAFAELGPGRTLMLFSFQPLYLGVLSYFLFDQVVDSQKFWAILFFIACLLIFSLENFKKEKSWQLKGMLFALLGIFLDGTGVIITRYAFDHNPTVTALEGNFYRTLGAITVFIVISFFKPVRLVGYFKELNWRSRGMVVLGAILGTYLSLAFYLKAIQIGHLASLSGLAITGTIFSSVFECIWERKWPSYYLVGAFIMFGIGMFFLL